MGVVVVVRGINSSSTWTVDISYLYWDICSFTTAFRYGSYQCVDSEVNSRLTDSWSVQVVRASRDHRALQVTLAHLEMLAKLVLLGLLETQASRV